MIDFITAKADAVLLLYLSWPVTCALCVNAVFGVWTVFKVLVQGMRDFFHVASLQLQ